MKSANTNAFDIISLYGHSQENDQRHSDYTVYKLSNETGTGIISVYHVMSGIQVIYNDMHMAYCNKNQKCSPDVIEINHCCEGRYECDVGPQTCCYMSPGDFSVGSLNRQFHNSCFPTNHYQGITIFIETEKLENDLLKIMNILSIDMEHIISLICNDNHFFIMRSNESIERIFSELYLINENHKPGYLKLKILELLLFLSDINENESFGKAEYLNINHVKTIKKLHNFIVRDIRKHYTINELSERFSLSPTTIKQDFSKIYGLSIYAYLKSYRLQQTRKLLLSTEESIAEIAAKIGYENPNKFSSSFKKEYGLTPTTFRNNVRLDR